MKNAYSAFMLSIFLCTKSVWASDCTLVPDCESLGFTKTEDECKGALTVFCPTDKTKAFCSCVTEVVQDVSVGAILYGDGTVSKACPLSCKTPIGVVFDTENRLAIALTDVKKDGTSGTQYMGWSNKAYDVPGLENCTSIKTGPVENGGGVEACGTNGRENTDKILACGDSCGGTPAATACNLYQPTGCNKDFCKKTKWFLPSMRDLYNIYQRKDLINITLTSLSKNFGDITTLSNGYWSSTEYNKDTAMSTLMTSGSRTAWGKASDNYVRPIVAF